MVEAVPGLKLLRLRRGSPGDYSFNKTRILSFVYPFSFLFPSSSSSSSSHHFTLQLSNEPTTFEAMNDPFSEELSSSVSSIRDITTYIKEHYSHIPTPLLRHK